MNRLKEWLSGLVARLPAGIHQKLLAAFLSIVVLLIVVGAVGLEVLVGVNRHAEQVVALQRKIAAYRQLQHDTTEQRLIVAAALLVPDNAALEATVRQLKQFGYDFDRLEFVAKDEVELLAEVREDYERFIEVAEGVAELIRAGKLREGRLLLAEEAGPPANRMERLTNQLVNRAEADMIESVEASHAAYLKARRIIVVVGIGSIVLALMLGYAISGSLVGPVRQMDTRFNEIAAGEFAGRVEVANRDELGNLAANLNRMNDELRRLYQQLEAANASKSRFLAAASHDLRQPVHALGLNIAQLRDAKSAAARERLIGKIEASSAAVSELIEALLDLSKLDAGAVAPQPGAFAVQDLLNRLEDGFAPAARVKGLRLRVRPSRLRITTDPMLLERIVWNLAANALRYTRDGGILIACRARAGVARFEVWDTGIGIAPAQQARVFEEFYQAHAADSAGTKGLGLGLAIVERLAALLGLRVTMASVPGRGSMFAVELPLAAAQSAPPAPPLNAQVQRDEGGLALVVDDDAEAREAAAGLLASWGWHVIAAAGPDEALAALGTQRPDVILADQHLGDGALGTELVARVRQRCGASVPALLVSGDVTAELRDLAGGAGLHLLHKPLQAARLRTLLHHLRYEEAVDEAPDKALDRAA